MWKRLWKLSETVVCAELCFPSMMGSLEWETQPTASLGSVQSDHYWEPATGPAHSSQGESDGLQSVPGLGPCLRCFQGAHETEGPWRLLRRWHYVELRRMSCRGGLGRLPYLRLCLEGSSCDAEPECQGTLPALQCIWASQVLFKEHKEQVLLVMFPAHMPTWIDWHVGTEDVLEVIEAVKE